MSGFFQSWKSPIFKLDHNQLFLSAVANSLLKNYLFHSLGLCCDFWRHVNKNRQEVIHKWRHTYFDILRLSILQRWCVSSLRGHSNNTWHSFTELDSLLPYVSFGDIVTYPSPLPVDPFPSPRVKHYLNGPLKQWFLSTYFDPIQSIYFIVLYDSPNCFSFCFMGPPTKTAQNFLMKSLKKYQ